MVPLGEDVALTFIIMEYCSIVIHLSLYPSRGHFLERPLCNLSYLLIKIITN
ncbi:hypothetical protein Lalb_Chr01g0011401 [Lupinus albus]|uniref:Uncharacterized protein n=1 Tax=Lupinus albus TaxID=3870 RepID=A0A6A4R678_LUPAL|nr:hypothetical protein Lalb_Chr01g0011401 [Lupinus albus]